MRWYEVFQSGWFLYLLLGKQEMPWTFLFLDHRAARVESRGSRRGTGDCVSYVHGFWLGVAMGTKTGDGRAVYSDGVWVQ